MYHNFTLNSFNIKNQLNKLSKQILSLLAKYNDNIEYIVKYILIQGPINNEVTINIYKLLSGDLDLIVYCYFSF